MCGVWNGCVLIWLQFFLSVLILPGFDWGYVYAELFWLTLSEKTCLVCSVWNFLYSVFTS